MSLLYLFGSGQIVDELLGGPPGHSSVGHLPLVGLSYQLILRQVDLRIPGGQFFDYVEVFPLGRSREVDGYTESRHQRKLFFNRIRMMFLQEMVLNLQKSYILAFKRL